MARLKPVPYGVPPATPYRQYGGYSRSILRSRRNWVTRAIDATSSKRRCDYIRLAGCGRGALAIGRDGNRERWLGEFAQGVKWIFCLSAARIAADQEQQTCREEPDGTTALGSRRR